MSDEIISKIGRGVDQLEADKTNSVPTSNLSRFSSGPKTLSELIQRAVDTDLRHGVFVRRMKVLNGEVSNRAEKINADMAGLTDLPENQRRSLAAKQIVTARREIRERTDKERYDILRDLHAAEAGMNAVAALYDSPARILAREGFGTEDRSRFLAQMAHSGPTEVAGFAALAVNTGNKILGAAVMSKLDALPKRERELAGVSRQELANILCGDDHRKAQEAITIARNRVQSSLNLNREFERGRANAKARIGEALAKRRETGVLDDDGAGGQADG